MDDTPANQTPGDPFNKLDLSALEAFQFGTQWTDAGQGKRSSSGTPGAAEPPRAPGEGGPGRRDRRPPRRPSDREGGAGGGGGGGGPAPSETDYPTGAEYPGVRRGRGPHERFGPREGGRERRESGGRFPRGPRSDFGGERGHGPRRPAGPPRPYISPVFEVTFYPDDTGFNALVKAMRASCRTYELFEIARLILGKLERCVVVFRRRPNEPGGAAGPLYLSVPDGLPFETEDEAISHALEHSLDQFFTTESVEVEPPKGNFQFVNRCPITKDLLGPPNYHRYPQIVQHHYAARGIRMPFEKYKAAIEVVRDPEAVNQWLESMKKATRYTYRGNVEPGTTAVYDNLEDARNFLLRACRERLVRTVETARVAARTIEAAGRTEAAHAMHGALEMQRRFPLDTANALRGRLRRENFHIFKRGSKGITYVCAVRRRFRQPGETFSDSIKSLIEFLDQHPMISVADLPLRFLGFAPPPPTPPPAAAPASEAAATGPAGEGDSAPPPAPAEPPPTLTLDQRNSLSRLMLDLRWLVSEGYVAEYSDGRLFAHPMLGHGQGEAEEKGHEGSEAQAASASEAASATEAPPGEEGPVTAEASAAASQPPAPMEAAPDTAYSNLEYESGTQPDTAGAASTERMAGPESTEGEGAVKQESAPPGESSAAGLPGQELSAPGRLNSESSEAEASRSEESEAASSPSQPADSSPPRSSE